jgi:glycosidase
MTNIKFEDIEDYPDIESRNMYKERIQAGYTKEEIMESIYTKGRDNARTPMQWSDSDNAGFTTGIPWIKVNSNYKEINAIHALEDKNSIFYYYKKLIEIRKEHEVVVYGDFTLLMEEDEDIFAYTRSFNGKKLLVVCNFYGNRKPIAIPEIEMNTKELLIANYSQIEDVQVLRPYEARMYLL